jgi:hypothetical protein
MKLPLNSILLIYIQFIIIINSQQKNYNNDDYLKNNQDNSSVSKSIKVSIHSFY